MFVDLKKALDRVPRKLIWWALRGKGVLEREIRAIIEIYNCVKTAVRMKDRRSEWFEVKIGVYQGSVSSPLLFAMALDEITKDIREEIPKEYLYADDLVLLGDCWSEVEKRYYKWKRALQEKGLKINVNETKAFYTGNIMINQSKVDPCAAFEKRVGKNSIRCEKCSKWVHKRCSGIKGSLARVDNFECKCCRGDVKSQRGEETIKLDWDNLEVEDKFCYLGDMLNSEVSVQNAVIARLRVGWGKFKDLLSALCKKGVSLRMKGIVYKACVRSAVCYGAERWAMRSEDENRIETTEIRMLRMMRGKTLKDKVRNENIRKIVQVENLREYLRCQRVRWCGHVERMRLEKSEDRVKGRKIERPRRDGRRSLMLTSKKEMMDPKNKEECLKGCKYRWTPASGDKHLVSTSDEINE